MRSFCTKDEIFVQGFLYFFINVKCQKSGKDGKTNMILYNLRLMAKNLMAEFQEVTEPLEHNGVKGSLREEILTNCLKELLPQKYSVGSGIIVDADQTQSRQQDFFIYDAFDSPVFLTRSSYQVVPIESVYATVEVKSSLNKTELEKCVKNIQSVKKLKLTPAKTLQWTPPKENQVMGMVFAYTSDISLEAVIKNLNEFNREMKIPYEEQINMICVLDKGVILPLEKNGLNNVRLMPNNNTMLCKTQGSMEDNLSLFYLLLQYHLNLLIKAAPDLMEYARKSNLIDSKVAIPLDDMDDKTALQIGNEALSRSEIEKICNLHRTIYQGENYTEEEKSKAIADFSKIFSKIAKANAKKEE